MVHLYRPFSSFLTSSLVHATTSFLLTFDGAFDQISASKHPLLALLPSVRTFSTGTMHVHGCAITIDDVQDKVNSPGVSASSRTPFRGRIPNGRHQLSSRRRPTIVYRRPTHFTSERQQRPDCAPLPIYPSIPGLTNNAQSTSRFSYLPYLPCLPFTNTTPFESYLNHIGQKTTNHQPSSPQEVAR